MNTIRLPARRPGNESGRNTAQNTRTGPAPRLGRCLEVITIDRPHRAVDGQHEERQHDVHHAHSGARQIVHQRQGLVPQSELHAPGVDQPSALKQNEPGVGAHEKRGPEGEKHADQAEVGNPPRQPERT